MRFLQILYGARHGRSTRFLSRWCVCTAQTAVFGARNVLDFPSQSQQQAASGPLRFSERDLTSFGLLTCVIGCICSGVQPQSAFKKAEAQNSIADEARNKAIRDDLEAPLDPAELQLLQRFYDQLCALVEQQRMSDPLCLMVIHKVRV